MVKISRNAPCICGSGKKYKKCCLPKEEENPGLVKLINRVKGSSLLEDTVIMDTPLPKKMSEIIIDFAQPLLDKANNDSAKETVISIAILVWNATLMPDEGMKKEIIKELCEGHKPLDGDDPLKFEVYTMEIVDFLWNRKMREFAAHKRLIADYQYEPSENGFHLNVGSVELSGAGDEK